MERRQRRLENFIQKKVSSIIEESLLPPEIGLITITDVKVRADLGKAEIKVSFYAKEKEKKGLRLLQKKRGFIRKILGKSLHIKKIPEIAFSLDEEEKKIEHINKLFDKIDQEKPVV